MWLSGLLILSSYDLVFLKDGVSVCLYFVHVSIAVFSSFSTGHKQYLDVPDSRALFINSITDNRFIIGSVFALRNIPLFTFSLMYHHSRVTCILSKHGCMILVTFANHILSWLTPSLNVLVEPFIVGVLRAILNQKMLNTGCSETWRVMFISHQACLQWQEYLWSVVLENLFEFFEFFLTYNCSKTWSCIGSMASVVHNVTSAQNFILNWFNDFFFWQTDGHFSYLVVDNRESSFTSHFNHPYCEATLAGLLLGISESSKPWNMFIKPRLKTTRDRLPTTSTGCFVRLELDFCCPWWLL